MTAEDLGFKKPTNEEELDVRRILVQFLRYWYLFALAILMALVAAFLYNRYTPSIFEVKASVLVQNAQKDLDPTSLLFGGGKLIKSDEIVNEAIIIKSFPLIRKTVEALDMNHIYYRETDKLGRLVDLYHDSPFRIEMDSTAEEMDFSGMVFLEFLSDDEVKISSLGDSKFEQNYQVGEWIDYQDTRFRVQRVAKKSVSPEQRFAFEVKSVDKLVHYYHGALSIDPEDKESSILALKLRGTIPRKSMDFINTLLEFYLASNLEEKTKVAANTINFIDAELGKIQDSLRTVETRLEMFKSTNKITDLGKEATVIFDQIMLLENQKADLVVREKYFEYLEENLAKDGGYANLISPLSLGISDPVLEKLTVDLVQLQLEKENNSNGQQIENPIVAQLDEQIEYMKNSIIENLNTQKKSNSILLEEIQGRLDYVDETARSLPGSERQLINIERVYELSERIYLLLMEKNYEARITRSSSTPDFRVIEPARLTSTRPVFPQKNFSYLLALFAGFMLPSLYVLGSYFYNGRIQGVEDVQNVGDIPYLGSVPFSRNAGIQYLRNNPKSMLAEEFRTIKSNVKFMAANGKAQVVLVTSFVPGEGKTFVSSNLSTILSGTTGRCILIGADLRKPKIHKELGTHNERGLSSLLVGEQTFDEVLQKTEIENLDVIPSGPIPPNPAELLEGNRMKELLAELREKYDYVIVDTPPLGLVSDPYLLLPHADTCLLVVREDYSRVKTLKILRQLYRDQKISKVGLVLNATKRFMSGYGYGVSPYGYGYYVEDVPAEKKGFISRIMGRFGRSR